MSGDSTDQKTNDRTVVPVAKEERVPPIQSIMVRINLSRINLEEVPALKKHFEG